MNTEEPTKILEFLMVNRKDLKEEIHSSLMEFFTELKTEKIWITQDEVKELLSIKSSTTIQAMRDRGLIEFTQPMKKLILYRRSSVLEYLENHSQKPF
jgi:hypothetical protein